MSKAKRAREARIFALAEVRHDVLTRAAGRCETCRCRVPPGEYHHVLSGIGKRRRHERLDTVVLVCPACHGALHRSDLDTLHLARSWANANRYAEALAEINRRIEGVLESKWGAFHP